MVLPVHTRAFMSSHFALVPAAGSGSRMDADLPKQYLPLAGWPLLWHTLRALASVPRLAHVWVVLSERDEWFAKHDWRAFDGRVTPLRCGGPSRAASVLAGLRAMDAEARDWVLVHDAARPCVTRALIDRLIDEVGDDDAGGLLALPVADTLKRAADDGRIARTVPRAGLWAAQTPQMFRHAMLRAALEDAPLDQVTDEAGAMERAGLRPRLVPGSAANLKVTLASDLVLAGRLLECTADA